MSTIEADLKRIAELPATGLVSEEDVKNKVVLPMLRALGYDDADFNYERRTGRGYVDVVVERFPTGIVVETKAPRTKLDQYHLEQLETYVFHKHAPGRATVAILTNGDLFHIYGVAGALWKNSLEGYRILSFKRVDLGAPALLPQIAALLAKQNNEKGTIPEAISCQKKRRDRLGPIEEELRELSAERHRIYARIQELHAEQASILGSVPQVGSTVAPVAGPLAIEGLRWKHTATPHILRLLKNAGADSRSTGVDRSSLDDQLVGKVEGVNTHQAVSHGLMELQKAEVADYEKKQGKIRGAWLK